MNVHVVCATPPTHVLQRMARALADQTGWSLSDKPNGAADLNYFMPYLSFEGVIGKNAAYFTHYEVNDAQKARRWAAVDRMVDGRIVTAAQYRARLASPSAVARPPIDLGKFTPPSARRRGDKPIVGVAGMTYRTGRKGEHLIGMLAQSRLSRQVRLIASGRGWGGVPTTNYAWERMQDFYHALDVLVCPSLVEGVPYPPIEALACGVQVVVPIGVGLLDDLPDVPGIWRYPAGDYDGMVAALRLALDDVGKHEAMLPACVAGYTAEAWAADHVRAFKEWFGG
jgi:glycosyltransferase involved in cell wall biosynthesis